MKLLLISNSTNAGEAYLGWPREYISEFLTGSGIKKILFVPYAGITVSWDDYEKRVAEVYAELGFEIQSVHRFADPVNAVMEAEAIAVGGGNTFNLVAMLHKEHLIEPIRNRVLAGMPYMGWSAGANVACPTLRTTNDMPITEPASFNCFNLVPFQINPHYLDANPEGHGGETRQQRIEEFIALNRDITVVGLREATLLQLEGDVLSLKGKRPMRHFLYGQEPKEFEPGADISFLV
ncbi:MAG: dipeptidase PepE [Bacteroidota bacterium]